MKNSIVLFTGNYGSRIVVRRRFIESTSQAESLLLLAEMLNYKSNSSKKNVSSYASGELSYRAYNYKGGYVLESVLSQAQVQGLSYVMKNPYKNASLIQEDLSDERIDMDERAFALCKERLAVKVSSLNKDCFIETMEAIKADYSPLNISLGVLKSKTIDEVKTLLKIVRESITGDSLFVGAKGKNEPLIDYKEFANSLHSLKYSQQRESLKINSSSENEGMLFTLSLGKNISSENDYYLTLSSLSLIKSSLLADLKAKFGSPVTIRTGILSENEAYLYLEVKEGKLSILKDKVTLKEGEKINLDFKSSFSSSLVEYHEKQLKKCIYQSEAIKDLLCYLDFGFDIEGDYIDVKEFDEKDVIANTEDVLVKNVFVNTRTMEEENND